MKIGIIAMSAKPLHAGHWCLIEKAASENDFVRLYVSTSDRRRKNEFVVTGAMMETIWCQISHLLPHNVIIEHCNDQTPIRKVYEYVGEMNENESQCIYSLYADENDAKRCYPHKSIRKYFNYLYRENLIRVIGISRNDTVNISGTQMRIWLSENNKEEFCKHLPEKIQDQGDFIWNTLNSN